MHAINKGSFAGWFTRVRSLNLVYTIVHSLFAQGLLYLCTPLTLCDHRRFPDNLCSSITGCLGRCTDRIHLDWCLLSILRSTGSNIEIEEAITTCFRSGARITISPAHCYCFVGKRPLPLWSNISTHCLYFTAKGDHDIHMANPHQCSSSRYLNNAYFHLL